MTTIAAPLDDLFRGLVSGVELRADDDKGTGSYMFGHFSVFDTWYEIDSWYEGQFIERTVKGAFRKTIKENRDALVSQFDHGYDFHVGDSPLGPIEELREEDFGPFYGVPLLDTDYNRDRVLPLLQGRLMDGRSTGSLLGSSFRFRVTRDEWVEPSKATDHNPNKLKERTIREVRLYEFGPVVFPANPAATAAARGLTDHYLARRLVREGRAQRAVSELSPLVDPAGLATGSSTTVAPASGHSTEPTRTLAEVRARIDIDRLRRRPS